MNVYTTRAGIAVAEHTGSERAIWDALCEHDPSLILTYEMERGRKTWKVLRWISDDRPAEYLCSWRDESTGEPLDLSHGLVVKVKQMDRGSRGEYVSAEEHNRRLDEQADREIAAAIEEASRDFIRANTKGFGHFSGPVKPSQALVMARARGRRSGRAT